MISKEKLKDYANKLMFDMEEKEYETLQQEFEIILQQMDLIGNIENIETVSPMTFPYINNEVVLRKDEDSHCIDIEDALKNCQMRKGREVKVPRVVE